MKLSIKEELVRQVTADLAIMRRNLFGPSKRAQRRERRSRQPWLKRLRLG